MAFLGSRDPLHESTDADQQAAMKDIFKFVKTQKVLLIGGQAMHLLLKPGHRLYEDPLAGDMDLMSPNAHMFAYELANFLHKHRHPGVTATAGLYPHMVHIKIGNVMLADIVFCHPRVFDTMWRDRHTVEGLPCASPTFIKMKLYYELSRPKDDPSRWDKIMTRLALMEAKFPTMPDALISHVPAIPDLNAAARNVIEWIKSSGAVLIGTQAMHTHMKKDEVEFGFPMSILTEDMSAATHALQNMLPSLTVKQWESKHFAISDRTLFQSGNKLVLALYSTTSCHSYHQTRSKLRIASLRTLVHFFLEDVILDLPELRTGESMLADAVLRAVQNQSPGKRFTTATPLACIGTPRSLEIQTARHLTRRASFNYKIHYTADFIEHLFVFQPAKTPAKRRELIANEIKKLYKGLLRP